MAKTNAEIQKAYRNRSGLTRLDIRIEGTAKRALERLAARQCLSQSAVLTELLLAAEREVMVTLNEKERYDFFACKPLPGNGAGTQDSSANQLPDITG